MHKRSWEYEDRADELAIAKIGDVVLVEARVRGAAAFCVDGWRQTDRQADRHF